MNICYLCADMSERLHIAGRLSPRRLYCIFTLVLSLLFGGMFMLMPVCADDLWYLADSVGVPGSLEYFTSTAATCLEHWTYDTGRLANMATAPFLALFPRWVYALVSALAVFVIIMAGVPLSGSPWLSGRSALWVLTVSFVVPWFEFLFTVVYASNYIWCAALGLAFLYLFVNDGSRVSSFLLAAFSVIVGWWHEGMSVPLFCACASWLVAMRERPSRRRLLMLGGLLAGIVVIMLMPAFRSMTGERVSHLVKSVWVETLINVVVYNCMFYLYVLLLVVALCLRRVRMRLMADRPALAFLLAAAAFGVVSTCVYVLYFNGARTGLFAQLVCSIALLRLLPFMLTGSRGGVVAGKVLWWLAALLSLVSAGDALAVQRRLTREYEDVAALAAKSRSEGRREVYFDATPITLGIDFLKPSYMLLNTEYGLGGIILIPSELKGFRPDAPGVRPCSGEGLYIYRNSLVSVRPMPAERVDVNLTTADGRVVRSRLRHRPFLSVSGDSCAAILPHAQQVDASLRIVDAALIEE